MNTKNEFVRQVAEQKYEFGFTTDVHTEIIEKGLNEDIVRLISAKKGEPEWMLEFRLKAFRYWKEQKEPKWGHVHVPEIDYQAISYYADPTAKPASSPADGGSPTIDPELEKTFDKLGIPLEERLALSGNTAVDAIMDSVSVKTTFRERLKEKGIRQSMSRKGNCLDNSVMENFFGLLKTELLYLQEFESVEHFKKELIEYLSWYNEKRIKVKLKGLTPLQFRNQSLKSA